MFISGSFHLGRKARNAAGGEPGGLGSVTIFRKWRFLGLRQTPLSLGPPGGPDGDLLSDGAGVGQGGVSGAAEGGAGRCG